MKTSNLVAPGSWLLLDLIYDSFIYKKNHPSLTDVYNFVYKELVRLDRVDLFYYDRIDLFLYNLCEDKKLIEDFDSKLMEIRYRRVDLMNIPSDLFG